MKKTCLTIAGSDSSGGAGIQADIKAMEANGVFAMSVITGLTAQNSQVIKKIEITSKQMITQQLECLFDDYKISGIKIGALFNDEVIKIVAEFVSKLPPTKIVLDPVMVSKTNASLLDKKSIATFIHLFSKMDLLFTPNIAEAGLILNRKIEDIHAMTRALQDLQTMGFKKILLKGGHLKSKLIYDMFSLKKGGPISKVVKERIQTKNTHGTGCSLSSSIVAFWVRQNDLNKAIKAGIHYVHEGIINNLNIGKGSGPINHFWKDKYDTKK